MYALGWPFFEDVPRLGRSRAAPAVVPVQGWLVGLEMKALVPGLPASLPANWQSPQLRSPQPEAQANSAPEARATA